MWDIFQKFVKAGSSHFAAYISLSWNISCYFSCVEDYKQHGMNLIFVHG